MARSLSLLLVAALACVAVGVTAQAPIPSRPDGFRVSGKPCSPVQINLYCDLLCPDCAQAWPTMKKLAAHYEDDMSLTYHTFPLPYHTYSFIAAQAARVCIKNGADAVEVADFFFAKQETFWNGPTMNMTVTATQSLLGDMLVARKLVTADAFRAGMASPQMDWETRVGWKYGCSRAVLGTPSWHVNGVAVQGQKSWSVADWQSVIDPLLAAEQLDSTPAGNAPIPTTKKPVPPPRPVVANDAEVASQRCQRRPTQVGRMYVANVEQCPPDMPACVFLPGQVECCSKKEMCIPNVGCRC